MRLIYASDVVRVAVGVVLELPQATAPETDSNINAARMDRLNIWDLSSKTTATDNVARWAHNVYCD
jgi:hypothetical protein